MASILNAPVGSGGALRFTADQPVAILSRTSNVDPQGVQPGTFGAQQHPVPLASYLSSADAGAVVTAIRQDAAFRTNIGFAAGPDGAAYNLALKDSQGGVSAVTTGALGVFGWAQPSIADLFPGTTIPADATLLVQVTRARSTSTTPRSTTRRATSSSRRSRRFRPQFLHRHDRPLRRKHPLRRRPPHAEGSRGRAGHADDALDRSDRKQRAERDRLGVLALTRGRCVRGPGAARARVLNGRPRWHRRRSSRARNPGWQQLVRDLRGLDRSRGRILSVPVSSTSPAPAPTGQGLGPQHASAIGNLAPYGAVSIVPESVVLPVGGRKSFALGFVGPSSTESRTPGFFALAGGLAENVTTIWYVNGVVDGNASEGTVASAGNNATYMAPRCKPPINPVYLAVFVKVVGRPNSTSIAARVGSLRRTGEFKCNTTT